MGTIIVGSLLAAAVVAVITTLVKNKIKGKSSCSCGCGGDCPHCRH
ncbi:MAG: FeoB-associated Cys-rich membrane protein [Treponema sp.]|nr:FeoB-associated Cys-rich membrane protein [Treponema sp.]